VYLQPGPAGYRQILRPGPEDDLAPSLVPSFKAKAKALFADPQR
jgi:hypothetical protein